MQIKLSELCDPDFKRDPFPLLRKLRENGPLVDTKIPLIGRLKLVTTYREVDRVLRDRTRFVIEAKNSGRKKRHDFQTYLPRMLQPLMKNMIRKDEPDHRRLRGLTDKAFRNKDVAAMRPEITVLTDRYLDELERESEFDLLGNYARAIPLAVICELLGLPQSDRPRFSMWVHKLTHASFPWGVLTAVPSIRRLNQYLRSRFDIERKEPVGGLISELVAVEEEGSQLSEDELLGTVFLLLVAGHETTTHLITLSVLTMLTRPDLRQSWLDDPDVRQRGVVELLRYLTPVQITKPRYAAEDMQIGEMTISRGEMCLAFLASANNDPEKFSEPESIDLRRDPNPHVGFGAGIHFCLGAQLALLETEIAITQFLQRMPSASLAVAEDQLRWSKKIGMRILYELPVARAGRSPS